MVVVWGGIISLLRRWMWYSISSGKVGVASHLSLEGGGRTTSHLGRHSSPHKKVGGGTPSQIRRGRWYPISFERVGWQAISLLRVGAAPHLTWEGEGDIPSLLRRWGYPHPSHYPISAKRVDVAPHLK